MVLLKSISVSKPLIGTAKRQSRFVKIEPNQFTALVIYSDIIKERANVLQSNTRLSQTRIEYPG